MRENPDPSYSWQQITVGIILAVVLLFAMRHVHQLSNELNERRKGAALELTRKADSVFLASPDSVHQASP
ncbi:hypothetical protein GCM10028805_00300 [Spirosoma harenae]